MSSYSPERDKSALYSAARAWAKRSLLDSGSILSDTKGLWRSEVLDELDKRFVQNYDEGEGTFIQKLQGQLSGGSTECYQLMAELMWASNLFPSNIGPATKRQNVMQIWSWSGSDLRSDSTFLSDEVLTGIGSAGTAYNTHRWRELSFAINILRELRKREPTEQREILADPWRFLEWLRSQPGAAQRQLLHILPHLIFPDTFERISSGGDKVKILTAFAGESAQVWRNRSPIEVDKALLQLRQSLESEAGSPIDFYSSELRPRWRATPSTQHDVADGSGRGFASALESFLEAYGAARSGPFTTSGPVSQAMRQLRQWLESSEPIASRSSIKVKISVGQGGWTKTPWIALLDERVTTSTQRGIYIVFLVAEDLSVTYLTLNQGMTDLVARMGQRGAVEEMLRVAAASRPLIAETIADQFAANNEIDLKSDTSAARNYEVGTIAQIALPKDSLPDDVQITRDLATLLAAYDRLIEVPQAEDLSELASYGIDQALEDLFLERAELERMLEIWKAKKNLILQGAPGVGKSFIARRLAYCLVGAKDPKRLQVVQFHQSYSYEDFIRGYRPDGEAGFRLQDGIFFEFCQRAARDQGRPYVLIVDEINRGNLSKILGELMLLIEHDKRGGEWSMRLPYMRPDEPDFFVPKNLYLLGMMNTADRSLSLVDYALRRRFSFVSMEPQFGSSKFREHLAGNGIPASLADRIVGRMGELNQEIGADRINLGPGFRIGHSFFCPGEPVADPDRWYDWVVRTEIYPLLEEYWFDDPTKADGWRERLLS
ncbi:MrcB family domain-containing protein [Sphingopyxis fribergensis]